MKPWRYLAVVIPAVVLVGTFWFLFEVRHTLMPFVMAAVLAYLANPLLGLLQSRGLRRDVSVTVLYLAIGAVFALAGYVGVSKLLAETAQLRQRAPRVVENLIPTLRERRIGAFAVGEIAADYLEKHREDLLSRAAQTAPDLALHFVELATLSFIVPFISFFIMLLSPEILSAVLSACPSRHVERLLHLLWALDESIGSYVRGVLLEAAIVALLIFVGARLIGLPFALYLGIGTGLANIIPFLGPVIGLVPALGVAFFHFGTMSGVLQTAAVFGVVMVFDNWVLQPVIVERAVNLHPLVILFALDAGATLGGLKGMLFAVPVACIVRLLFQTGWEWYRTEFLAPDEAEKSPAVPA